MSKTDVIIRPARLPQEVRELTAFIHALQVYEHAFEPNRRVDDKVAGEYLRVLMQRVAANDGRIFVAEQNGTLVGWLVSLIEERAIYISEAERKVGYIVELFVIESARGQGIATTLARAAEADFRARGHKTVMIGVLPGNDAARAAYASWGYAPYAIELRKRL